MDDFEVKFFERFFLEKIFIFEGMIDVKIYQKDYLISIVKGIFFILKGLVVILRQE